MNIKLSEVDLETEYPRPPRVFSVCLNLRMLQTSSCMHDMGCCYYLGKLMQVNLTSQRLAQIFMDHQILDNTHVLSVLSCIQAYIIMMYSICAH